MRKIVFVDVDDTLIRSAGSKRIPVPSVVKRVRALKSEGAQIFLWSTGGADYCETTAFELGVADCIDGCLPKPTVYIDDQPVAEWRDCRHVYPMNADGA